MARKAKSKAVNYDNYIQDILRAEFEYCAKDVVYWANNYCVIEDKDEPGVIVPFKGWPAQNQTLRDFDAHRLNLVLKARQMGITWIALYYCTHDLIFKPGHTVVALSKEEDGAKELVRRMGVILDNQPEILRGGGLTWRATATSVQISGTEGKLVSTFKAFPASSSAAQRGKIPCARGRPRPAPCPPSCRGGQRPRNSPAGHSSHGNSG